MRSSNSSSTEATAILSDQLDQDPLDSEHFSAVAENHAFFTGPSEEISDPLRAYLREIGRYPLLTDEQERLLAQRMESGDRLAEKALVEANLRLVVDIAKRHSGCGLELLDL